MRSQSLFGDSIAWFVVESSAPEIVNHQQADIHTHADQNIKGIHVPEETSSFNQYCSLRKNVPRRQRSKGGLQSSGTTNTLQHYICLISLLTCVYLFLRILVY